MDVPNRIVATGNPKARVVRTGFAFHSPSEVSGADLSSSRKATLRETLKQIDQAQHAALATGDRYYLGTKPRV
jgi:hypothetical protein